MRLMDLADQEVGEAGAVSIVIDEKTGTEIQAAIDNSNIDGVLACEEVEEGIFDCTAGNGSGVLTGFEVKIPLDVLGYTEGNSLKVVAFINNSDHFYVSNQVLPGVNGLNNLESVSYTHLTLPTILLV